MGKPSTGSYIEGKRSGLFNFLDGQAESSLFRNGKVLARRDFHTAFEDLSVPDDAPDRWSIEVRCIVIYE